MRVHETGGSEQGSGAPHQSRMVLPQQSVETVPIATHGRLQRRRQQKELLLQAFYLQHVRTE